MVFCTRHLIAEVLVHIPGYSIWDRLGESGVFPSTSFRHPVTAIAFSLASLPHGTSVTLWHGCREFLFFLNIRRNAALSHWIPRALYENSIIMLYLLKWWKDSSLALCLNLYIFYDTKQIFVIWSSWPIQMSLHTFLTGTLIIWNISLTSWRIKIETFIPKWTVELISVLVLADWKYACFQIAKYILMNMYSIVLDMSYL